MFSTWPLLSLLIWLPILGGVASLFFGDQRAAQARSFALLVALITFVLSLALFGLDQSSASMQFSEFHPWIETFGIGYNIGVDGISVALIVLTTLVTPLVLVGAWTSIDKRVHQYFASFLILEGLMIGVFCALDAMLFYVFF
ncbi:MAG: NADH-quinone oxidoreductase subunit M, partial [Arenimonas sp.]